MLEKNENGIFLNYYKNKVIFLAFPYAWARVGS